MDLTYHSNLIYSDNMITTSSQSVLAPWLEEIRQEVILPCRQAIVAHPFLKAMQAGTAQPNDAQRYFSGLMWHLLPFGLHVGHLFQKRPPEVTTFLAGLPEDQDGDTEILGRIVEAFGGPLNLIVQTPWHYQPHSVWVHHDALLRAAIYSPDLSWHIGTAALNVGIESLVPTMIEPLFEASVAKYGVTSRQAQWLESRAGAIEQQHGENGFLILNHFVDPADLALQAQCRFWIKALSASMGYGLLSSGLPLPDPIF